LSAFQLVLFSGAESLYQGCFRIALTERVEAARRKGHGVREAGRHSLPIAERILLIINRGAGIGHSDPVVGRLRATLVKLLGEQATLQVEVVAGHPAARTRAKEFLDASDVPGLIIVGGGGGTLRAVIEGLCEGSEEGRLPGRDRVLIPFRYVDGIIGICQRYTTHR
jgi:hypothetical protein